MRQEFPEVLDSTMRGSWKACPRKFFWNYIFEIAPDGENVHLHAGGCFAKGLEVSRMAFYAGGSSYEDAILDGAEAFLKAWGNFDAGEHTKTVDRMLGAYEFYHQLHQMPTDHIQPLILGGRPAVEFNFVLPIPGTRHPRTGQPILYAGRSDMLGHMRGQQTLFVVDEKTTSQLGPTWGNQWLIRAQFTGYVWGARQHGNPVAGAVIRGISILKEKYGNAEVIVYRQDWQVEEWLETLRRDCDAMVQQWQEMETKGLPDHPLTLDDEGRIIEVQLPDRTPFAQSLDQACAAYGGCPFLRLCDSPNPENFIPIYYRLHQWDPTVRHS